MHHHANDAVRISLMRKRSRWRGTDEWRRMEEEESRKMGGVGLLGIGGKVKANFEEGVGKERGKGG